MALPVLESNTFELTLPSSDVKVKYRPFLVKEEKILLQAMESKEQKQIVQALKDIVSVCTFGQLNVDDLPIGDNEKGIVESVFKSIGPGLVDTVIFASANINIIFIFLSKFQIYRIFFYDLSVKFWYFVKS